MQSNNTVNKLEVIKEDNINYIILPKYWDYEYMSKKEALAILDKIKTFVEEYYAVK